MLGHYSNFQLYVYTWGYVAGIKTEFQFQVKSRSAKMSSEREKN